MPFGVSDFQDLVRLMEAHPEWRAELRRLVLSEELLSLPEMARELGRTVEQLAREFAASRAETDRRFQELAEAQRQTEIALAAAATQLQATQAELAHLAEAQRRTETALAAAAMQLQATQAELAHLAEAQSRTETALAAVATQLQALQAEVAHLAAALQALQAEVAHLAAALQALQAVVAHLEAEVARLAEAQRETAQQVRELARVQAQMLIDLADLKGDSLERRYRDRAGAYFGRLLRRVRVLSVDELDTLLEKGLNTGMLDEAGELALREADLIVRGQRRDDGLEMYLVVEVSWSIGTRDVKRAAERAALLRRLGLEAVGVVAGHTIRSEADKLVGKHGVWQVLDGRARS